MPTYVIRLPFCNILRFTLRRRLYYYLIIYYVNQYFRDSIESIDAINFSLWEQENDTSLNYGETVSSFSCRNSLISWESCDWCWSNSNSMKMICIQFALVATIADKVSWELILLGLDVAQDLASLWWSHRKFPIVEPWHISSKYSYGARKQQMKQNYRLNWFGAQSKISGTSESVSVSHFVITSYKIINICLKIAACGFFGFVHASV